MNRIQSAYAQQRVCGQQCAIMSDAATSCLISVCCGAITKSCQIGQIIFRDYVEWEIRSPDIYMMRLLESAFRKNGIHYGNQHFSDVALRLMNETVEKDSIHIRMLSPICLYSTNKETKKTYFYSPEEAAFPEQVNDNFVRKYTACYGIPPNSGIEIETVNVRRRDKYVTRYKEFYLSGWLGEYRLTGERKYLVSCIRRDWAAGMPRDLGCLKRVHRGNKQENGGYLWESLNLMDVS